MEAKSEQRNSFVIQKNMCYPFHSAVGKGAKEHRQEQHMAKHKQITNGGTGFSVTGNPWWYLKTLGYRCRTKQLWKPIGIFYFVQNFSINKQTNPIAPVSKWSE